MGARNGLPAPDPTGRATLVQFLSAHRLFGVLPPEALEELPAVAVERAYPKGHHPFYVGDPSSAVFVLESGLIAMTEPDGRGQEHTVLHCRPGDLFGLSTSLLGIPRTATATALMDSQVFIVPKETLDSLYHRFPPLAHQLIRELCGVLRRSELTTFRLTLTPIVARIAAFLLESSATAAALGAEVLTLDLPLSYQDMALLLGTTRETVNREFARLCRAEVIALRGQRVDILRPEVLRRMAEA